MLNLSTFLSFPCDRLRSNHNAHTELSDARFIDVLGPEVELVDEDRTVGARDIIIARHRRFVRPSSERPATGACQVPQRRFESWLRPAPTRITGL